MAEEDEVLREIDVVVSEFEGGSLLQFPLRPIFADSPQVADCRLKPVNKRLRMDVVHGPYSQLHTSSVVCPDANLCVGVIRNGALHLSPLNTVFQMRPCFDEVLFDDEEEVEIPKEKLEDKAAAIQQVHVRAKESDRARATKEQSYASVLKRAEEEPFHSLRVYPMNSEESSQLFESLYFKGDVTPMEI